MSANTVQKEIILRDKAISYSFRKSRRARRICLVVHRDGSIVLTSPIGMPEMLAERFIRQKMPWIISKLDFFSHLPKNSIPCLGRKDYLKLRERARVFVMQKLRELNAIYGFEYHAVSIRNQKTCWGSCSRKGNLNFNFRIIFLPEKLQNYVIVHELCHLKELNHSPQFWALVARTVPNWAVVRQELKTNRLDR